MPGQPTSLCPSHNDCERAGLARAYVLQSVAVRDLPAINAHIASCPNCQRELKSLWPVIDRFVFWPTDVLRPTTSLQGRLANRIAEEAGTEPVPPPPPGAATRSALAGW